MRTSMHLAPLAVTCAIILAACASGDKAAEDSAAAAATATAASDSANRRPANISLAQLAGKWNLRAVPESGSDTTPTLVVLTATADTTGWTMTMPNQPPVPLTVRVSGDSVTTQSAPYQSTRRKGMKVTTQGTMRMQGDSLVGMTIARYTTTGPDSVLRLRSVGKRAP